MEIGKKYVVVAPVLLGGNLAGREAFYDFYVAFEKGDVVTLVQPEDRDGDVLAVRESDGLEQYISAQSLVELQEEPAATTYDSWDDVPESVLVKNDFLFLLKVDNKVVVNSISNGAGPGWLSFYEIYLSARALTGPYVEVELS